MNLISFNRPCLAGNEFAYMRLAVDGMRISGDGDFTKRAHSMLEGLVGARRALLTTSCTHALEMVAHLLDLAPGDEVIVPSYTFVSTANAFALRSAVPVFADVRKDTLNLDEAAVEGLVSPRTRAIVAVHYAGIACEMETLLEIAARRGLTLVEDNAHGFLGAYRGRPLGSLGALATLSFHETKNFTCGEGGALLLNDERFVARAEILREKGTDRGRFFRGEVDKYTWVDLGSSYLPSDLLAAFLVAQLEARERIQARRRAIWEAYAEGLDAWALRTGARLPFVPPGCDPAWHLFFVVMPDEDARQRMLAHLADRGVNAVFHYVPLHLSPMGRRLGGRSGSCPVSEWASARLLRLPLHLGLTDEDVARVVDAVTAYRA
ncbi:MAG TPA: dTDP-4-amino-4,6-dideoxygalactose transaminase [Thermoanaerobaculia bacterium]|nr:dTDP-4-amino-4,6-dideoxygalactose transaminase [Thermoanaerobaculia bacterium]